MAINEPYENTRPRNDERQVELTPVEARQGYLGRPVLVVLVVGILLALVAWAAAEFWGMSIDTQTPASQVTAPAADPATSNGNVINDNAPAGEDTQPAPAVVDPTTP